MLTPQKHVPVEFDFDTVLNVESKNAMVKPTYTVGMMMRKLRDVWLKDSVSDIAHKGVFLLFKDVKHDSHILQPITKPLGDIHSEFGYPAVVNVFVKVENTFG
tara:strand:- start:25 stop:333 length:309 start_codon:yes stop_codon:yes gene_type:complete